MVNASWLSVVYSYVLESIVESAIIVVAMWSVMRWRRLSAPATTNRFLLLPLVIPVICSPAVHLLFPQLAQLSLAVQIERRFPWLGTVHLRSEAVAPVLLAVFCFLCILNLAQWLVIWLRETRDATRIAHRALPYSTMPILESLGTRIGVPSPQLVISERRPFSAYVFGWRRPTISLGRAWLTRLDRHELEALFAHELAHYRRGDTWQILIAKVCRDLMFFNPLAHYAYRKLLVTCEEAADDRALAVTGRPLALASCLLKFWRVGQRTQLLPGTTNLTGAGLEERIHRLMVGGHRDPIDRSVEPLFYGLSLVLILVLSVV